MIASMNVKNSTTRIKNKLDKLYNLLAQEGINMISMNKEKDFILNRKLNTVFINIDRILKYEHASSIDVVCGYVCMGYFS